MKLNVRLLLLAIFLIVFLCSVFIISGPISVAHREKVKKQEAISKIIDYIQDENVALEDEELRTISERVYDESKRCNVDYRLVLALMKIESNFRYDAVSKRGARGLMQVKPSLAKYIAENVGIGWQGDKTLDEPEKNIKIGVHIFSKLIEDFQGINMALHAYHVGPTRLREILTKKKTPQKHYLNLVLDEYDRNISLLPAP
jgi:soluble lytic murein transglycosylase